MVVRGKGFSSPSSFLQQASGQIFKDDVNGLCSFPLSATGQDDDYESRRFFSTPAELTFKIPAEDKEQYYLKKDNCSGC